MIEINRLQYIFGLVFIGVNKEHIMYNVYEYKRDTISSFGLVQVVKVDIYNSTLLNKNKVKIRSREEQDLMNKG